MPQVIPGTTPDALNVNAVKPAIFILFTNDFLKASFAVSDIASLIPIDILAISFLLAVSKSLSDQTALLYRLPFRCTTRLG